MGYLGTELILTIPLIEFKKAKNDFSFEELGKYFSALSNEANLHNVECAWLVFGVEDKKHKVVGTNYRLDDKSLNNLKEEIAKHTTGNNCRSRHCSTKINKTIILTLHCTL